VSALAGLRVLELGTGVGAAYCGKLLAGLGADVIKVEPPAGDSLRFEGPFPGDEPHLETSGLFLHLNTGKRSVVASAGERDRLLAEADVVVLSGRPSELTAAGLVPDELRARFPRLVVTCISTFGQTGPYAEYLGGELIAYALGGYMLLTGPADRPPLKAYGHLVEYQAGAHAALGTLAALRAREFTGTGQVVDVSAMEAATFMIGGVQQGAHFYGRIARRAGTRLLGVPAEQPYPSTIRPCRDGHVHCHSNNRHYDLLGTLIGHPRLHDPEVLARMTGHADEIDAILDEWLADKDREDVVRIAQEMRLPFTEVRTPSEVLADPHLRERETFAEIEHPVAGTVTLPAMPMRMSATPPTLTRAPLLGEHTGERFGMADVSPPFSPATSAGGPRPLSGIRVVDFTNAVAGPIASFILADLGADVIKVEGPAARHRNAAGLAPLAEGGEDVPWDRVAFFNELNHGKRGVTIDVTKPRGRNLFLKLVAKADVVVQNFSPRALDNMRLHYEHLRGMNPSIVMLSMPAFGLSGPYRDRASYGPGIDAMSGLAHLTGYPDGPPMKPGNFFCDQQAGTLAAYSCLAALRHRDLTGEGQHVELAMIEGELQLLADAYLDYHWNGRERLRAGNDLGARAPHDAYRCAGEDEWVAIAVEDEDQWHALCAAIGLPSLATDERFASPRARTANRDELRAVIEAWTSTRSHYEAMSALQPGGVPAGAALNCLELLSDPHIAARGGFEYVQLPNAGRTPYPRVAFTLSDTPIPISAAGPAFGGANRDVFCGLLGLSDEEFYELERAGICPREPAGGH
jgi:crotonobetainyl-CoA:carnitine CoA-transferase CaiB-like acyl-CoA transferase